MAEHVVRNGTAEMQLIPTVLSPPTLDRIEEEVRSSFAFVEKQIELCAAVGVKSPQADGYS